MGIWDFDTFETADLERIVEISDELTEMGLDVLDEDMMMEVHAELERREEDAEDEEEGDEGCTCGREPCTCK